MLEVKGDSVKGQRELIQHSSVPAPDVIRSAVTAFKCHYEMQSVQSSGPLPIRLMHLGWRVGQWLAAWQSLRAQERDYVSSVGLITIIKWKRCLATHQGSPFRRLPSFQSHFWRKEDCQTLPPPPIATLLWQSYVCWWWFHEVHGGGKRTGLGVALFVFQSWQATVG